MNDTSFFYTFYSRKTRSFSIFWVPLLCRFSMCSYDCVRRKDNAGSGFKYDRPVTFRWMSLIKSSVRKLQYLRSTSNISCNEYNVGRCKYWSVFLQHDLRGIRDSIFMRFYFTIMIILARLCIVAGLGTYLLQSKWFFGLIIGISSGSGRNNFLLKKFIEEE